MKTFVETYNQIEGFHRWPGAPESVGYLKSRHRHMFVIRCSFEVRHEDRDIEINTMQTLIEDMLHHDFGNPIELQDMSCERLAHHLLEIFEPNGIVKATVLEDGYGGATLTR